jgi:predicted XRE-type DNA-binding protein
VEISKPYYNVFEALEDDAEVARNLAIRAALMRELEAYIEREGLTQAQAAERLGVTQPRISDLVRGKIDLFTIDALVNLLSRVGLAVQVAVREKHEVAPAIRG